MRDDNYLQGRLDYLWDRYFGDIEQKNDVVIRFGRKTRSRLGSIKQSQAERISNSQLTIPNKIQNSKNRNNRDRDWIPRVVYPALDAGARMTGEVSYQSHRTPKPNHPTTITINGLFRDPDIPEFLIDSVIAHEMVHYAHGFASPHEKKYDTPHAGGVIKKEMQERGLEDLYLLQKKWLKDNWREFVDKHLPRKDRTIRRKRRRNIIRIFG